MRNTSTILVVCVATALLLAPTCSARYDLVINLRDGCPTTVGGPSGTHVTSVHAGLGPGYPACVHYGLDSTGPTPEAILVLP